MRLLWVILCCAVAPLWAAQDPCAMIGIELGRLDTLITATDQSLEVQKKLRNEIVEYQRNQEKFLLSPNDNDLLVKMARSAFRTLELIQESHLEQTFDPDFINELKVLSKVVAKRGIPKP